MTYSSTSRIIILFAVIAVLALGCATVPVVRAWRPWVQTNRAPQEIPLHASFTIKVEGETEPLIGDEKLRQESVKAELSRLMQRRGFRIVDSLADFTMTLKYKTSERESFDMSSWSSSSQSSYLDVFSGSASSARSASGALATPQIGIGLSGTRGWGVAIAGAVARQSLQSQHSSDLSKKTEFVNVMALKISHLKDSVFWNSDAMWESESPDLYGSLTPALQTIVIDLPLDTRLTPEVFEVDESRAGNFRRLYTDGRWFSCPALPYRVAMGNTTYPADTSYYNSIYKRGRTPDTDPIQPLFALAAIVDLIQTSEFALPCGNGKWKDPLAPNLWSKVLIGGRYRLLPSDTVVNVLVKLKGNFEGYRTDKCWIATDEEYADFLAKLSKWKQAVADYRDVFKK